MRHAGFLACLAVTAAAQQPVLLQSVIRSIRLHPGEAWVTRTARVTLSSPGGHVIQIGGLPEGLSLDDLRIQARGPEGTTLGELRMGSEPPRPPDTPEAQALLARLTALHDRKALLDAQQGGADQASGFLDAYQQNLAKVGATGSVPSPAAILETSRSLEARYVELAVQSQARKLELQRIEEEMKPLEASWQALRARLGSDRTPSRLTLELSLAKAGEVQLQVSTRTMKARWKPSYEAKVLPDGKVELSLYAVVSQLSGESWDKVQLEISSANPERSQDLRTFNQDIRLNWAPPVPIYPGDRRGVAGATVEVNALQATMDTTATATGTTISLSRTPAVPGAYVPPRPSQPALEATADLSQGSERLFKTYLVEGLRDLPSDGEARRYRIASATVPALQIVVVTPRLETTAHSVVRFQVPSELPLFPGSPLSRFAGQQRLGQGPLEIPPAGQPMQITLGPFPALRTRWVNLGQSQPYQTVKLAQVRQVQLGVSRDLLKEEVVTKGADRLWSLQDEFILNNDADEPLEVELRDRLVSSVHESVSVRLSKDTTPGSESIPAQHLRRWRLTIPPRSEQRVELGLEIHAPKDGRVIGLEAIGLQ